MFSVDFVKVQSWCRYF